MLLLGETFIAARQFRAVSREADNGSPCSGRRGSSIFWRASARLAPDRRERKHTNPRDWRPCFAPHRLVAVCANAGCWMGYAAAEQDIRDLYEHRFLVE